MKRKAIIIAFLLIAMTVATATVSAGIFSTPPDDVPPVTNPPDDAPPVTDPPVDAPPVTPPVGI